MATSVVSLTGGPGTGDPNRPSLEEALEVVQDAALEPLSAADKLARMAAASGDISEAYPAELLAEIGETCVANYERDKQARKGWEDTAREALNACAQEEQDKAKEFPWKGASNMRWPLLTIAAMQFNARMLPAVIKADEAVLCKVIGSDNGVIATAPNPQTGEIQPVPAVEPDPQTGQPQLQPKPVFLLKPGAKTKRARRVADYMNTVLFYRMENWEDDTDALLMQLPAVGCVFRKQWTDENGRPESASISALNIVVPQGTRTLPQALRITEEIENVYPHEIVERMRREYYRTVDLGLTETDGTLRASTDESDGARMLLEQHCRWDFDKDGVAEPYIVTLDHQTRRVLRIEPNFGPEDIESNAEGKVIHIKPRQFYTKYAMFPHPKGNFYDLGLGHLLKNLNDGVDTMLNQLIDAGTAQTAGGGFIGSGVRLQSRGSNGVVRFSPGTYKTVDVPGDALRANIVEATRPNVSPVTFQVLEMILGAARDIAGIKDVMTGEASNTGQVGTTLALIEQGLQVFNSCAKRIFRALKAEFELLYSNIRNFGGAAAAADYQQVLDDQEADFAADFDAEDLDIRPISDPSTVTRMQKMTKAQFLLSQLPAIQATGGNPQEVVRRALEAADVEDIDKIYPPPPPRDPMQEQAQMQAMMENLRKLSAEADDKEASALSKQAKAMLDAANAAAARFELSTAAGEHGMEMGQAAALLADPQR